jgi:hypothetical protein
LPGKTIADVVSAYGAKLKPKLANIAISGAPPVTPEMWAYEVSGKQVLWHWFSYRRRDRTRPIIGDRRPPSPLDSIQPDHWLPEYTNDLIDLLNVLGRLIALEPAQADLLNRICAGALQSAEELRAAGAFTVPEIAGAPKRKRTAEK